MAVNIIFVVLSLIFNYFSFKLAVAVYKGFFTGCPFFCVSCNPCVPVWSGDVIRHRFWPIIAWDSWPSPPVLKVGNVRKAFMPP